MGTLLAMLGKVGMVAAIAVAFMMGLAGSVYFSLRSPEVRVPEVVGKNRFDSETTLEEAGLHIRVRASRYSPAAKTETVLDQSPRAGEVVKVGQTVAVIVSRATPRAGEVTAEEQIKAEIAKDTKNRNSEAANKQDEGQNDAPINKNVNANKVANRNANNRRANTNNVNAKINGNANANRNVPQNTTINRNANVSNRNTSIVGNTDSSNANSNAKRRPPAAPTPLVNPATSNPRVP